MALLNALLHYDTLRHHIYYDYYFFTQNFSNQMCFYLIHRLTSNEFDNPNTLSKMSSMINFFWVRIR